MSDVNETAQDGVVATKVTRCVTIQCPQRNRSWTDKCFSTDGRYHFDAVRCAGCGAEPQVVSLALDFMEPVNVRTVKVEWEIETRGLGALLGSFMGGPRDL